MTNPGTIHRLREARARMEARRARWAANRTRRGMLRDEQAAELVCSWIFERGLPDEVLVGQPARPPRRGALVLALVREHGSDRPACRIYAWRRIVLPGFDHAGLSRAGTCAIGRSWEACLLDLRHHGAARLEVYRSVRTF